MTNHNGLNPYPAPTAQDIHGALLFRMTKSQGPRFLDYGELTYAL